MTERDRARESLNGHVYELFAAEVYPDTGLDKSEEWKQYLALVDRLEAAVARETRATDFNPFPVDSR